MIFKGIFRVVGNADEILSLSKRYTSPYDRIDVSEYESHAISTFLKGNHLLIGVCSLLLIPLFFFLSLSLNLFISLSSHPFNLFSFTLSLSLPLSFPLISIYHTNTHTLSFSLRHFGRVSLCGHFRAIL